MNAAPVSSPSPAKGAVAARARWAHRLVVASYVAPATCYAAVLFYSGLIPMGPLPEVHFMATDKLLHAVAFGGLALLLVRALRPFTPVKGRVFRLIGASLGSSMLGALLELCQALVPYRSSDAFDWIADSIGAALAVALLRLAVALATPLARARPNSRAVND